MLKALTIAALSIALLASCSSGSRSADLHVLRIVTLTDPASLDPLLAHDQETIGNDLLVCQTLIGLNEHNRLVPILLSRIPTRENHDVSADGSRIVYHLRRGVRFADGAPLTSKDVAFTYRAILDSRNNVLSSDAYRRIETLQTPDPYTVVVRLRRPWNAAVSDLFAQSDFAFGILPAHAFADTRLVRSPWEMRPFGTGPFRVAQWRRGDRIILVRNPYYAPRPKLDRIELRVVPDGNSAFVALRTREVDVAALTTPQMLQQARGIAGIHVIRTPENGTEWMSLQTTHPPLADIRVREAVAYALDMTPIRKSFDGVYPQAGSFLPPVMRPWHVAGITPYAHDLRRARALLAGKTIDATLVIVSENPLWSRIATVVQQELAPVGIRVSIKKYPTPLFNAPDGPIRNGRFTMAIDGWLGGADPEQSIVFTCSQATVDGDNISRYCSPRFDALFADQATTSSAAGRIADFARMQTMIHAAIPVVPIFYWTWYDGADSRVHGFARNMLQYPVNSERWDAY